MSLRPVQVLIPAWGKPYVSLLADLALPSLLTPGNLPAVPAGYAVTFVFLTRQRDVPVIKNTEAFARLSLRAAATFIVIDDLIVPAKSGLTLTRAYGRAITDLGDAATNTIFVLFNADFVISDGGLPRAIELCNRHTAVLASSLRCNDEMRPELTADLRRDTTNATRARMLVRMTLKNLHPTVAANFVTQQAVHHAATHQLFWRVDDTAILGHFGLLFPLAFRPSIPLRRVEGYCDYAFIPLMCPSVEPFIVSDSDDIFLLELQRRDHELHYLRFGFRDRNELAKALGSWMTHQHRQAFTKPILIHSDDPPEQAADTARRAATLIGDIMSRMPRDTQPYLDHPYWNGVIATLRNCPDIHSKEDAGGSRNLRSLPAILRGLYRAAAGIPPETRLFHLSHVDYRHIHARAKEIFAERPLRLLYVTDTASDIDDWVTRQAPASTRILTSDLWDCALDTSKPPFDAVFGYLQSSSISRLPTLVEFLKSYLTPGAHVMLAFHDRRWEQNDESLERQILLDLAHILPVHLSMQISVRGGSLRRLVYRRLMETAASVTLRPTFGLQILAVAKFAMLVTIMTAINVTHRSRRPSANSMSSIVFSYRL